MSQAAVEKTLGKLLTDECFRRRFFMDPAAASFAAGLELSRLELDALSRLSVEAIARLSERLDHRICRLPLEGDGGPGSARVTDARDDRPLAGPPAGVGAAQCARKKRARSGATSG